MRRKYEKLNDWQLLAIERGLELLEEANANTQCAQDVHKLREMLAKTAEIKISPR
jgi:hypothetical protein